MFGITPFERNELWNPFKEFEKDFFKDFGGVSRCRTDIRDEGDKYILECEMPGFEKDDIKIDINGNTLTLCANHDSDNSEKNKNGEYVRRERHYGSYCRNFDISGIDENTISASYINGILKLTMPKKAKDKPQSKKIEIQ